MHCVHLALFNTHFCVCAGNIYASSINFHSFVHSHYRRGEKKKEKNVTLKNKIKKTHLLTPPLPPACKIFRAKRCTQTRLPTVYLMVL